MIKPLLLVPLLVIGISMVYAIESNQFISVQVQDKINTQGDIIPIKGYISTKVEGHPILVSVTNPMGNIITIDQIQINRIQEFKFDINTAGDFFKYNGIYNLRISYYTEHIDTEFILDNSFIKEVTGPPCIRVNIDADICLEYNMTGGHLKIVNIDEEKKSLIILFMEPSNKGDITIKIPSDVFDGMNMVLVNDDITDNVLVKDEYYTIQFKDGTSSIEMIGTHVMPEFGFIGIMLISVFGIIISGYLWFCCILRRWEDTQLE